MPASEEELRQRFMEKVSRDDSGCWLWTGAVGNGRRRYCPTCHAMRAARRRQKVAV